ncbi:uncharacterized protein LOC135341423 isoform X2 [Halichondria panicea]|uniref:uncharacterized protein LOC135341423 isoform X2 n=1 Tax=Halichondria panicea TaxID=6063 RepID=UPI00312B5331
MSDRLSKKWTVAILLGAGTVVVAGGIALGVYYARKRHNAAPPQDSVYDEQPVIPVVEEPVVEVVEEPVLPVVEETCTVTMDMKDFAAGGPMFPLQGTRETDFGRAAATYEDIYQDVQNGLKPLFDNDALYSAFLEYIQVSTRALERLKSLSDCLKQYEGAITANQPAPTNTSTDLNSIINALSPGSELLAEVKSLTPLLAALMECPSHIIRNAVSLTSTKRQTLVDLIRSTPYGVDKYVYMNEGPFRDSDLQPFMTRMGFSIPSYQSKLTFSADDTDDKLTTGLFLLLGTAGSS